MLIAIVHLRGTQTIQTTLAKSYASPALSRILSVDLRASSASSEGFKNSLAATIALVLQRATPRTQRGLIKLYVDQAGMQRTSVKENVNCAQLVGSPTTLSTLSVSIVLMATPSTFQDLQLVTSAGRENMQT